MKRPTFIARQSGNPKGLLGTLIGTIMAKETAAANQTALALLELERGDRLLEIGSGHGATMFDAAARIQSGLVAGIDISAVMVRLAKKRNRKAIKSGLVEVTRAGVKKIPYPSQSFNKLLSVHTIYFLSDLAGAFSNMFNAAAPGGRLVLCFRPGDDPGFANTFPPEVYHIRSKAEVLETLEAAGFQIIDAHEEIGPNGTMIFAVADRPAG